MVCLAKHLIDNCYLFFKVKNTFPSADPRPGRDSPTSDIVLIPEDLLWVVGETKRLQNLSQSPE